MLSKKEERLLFNNFEDEQLSPVYEESNANTGSFTSGHQDKDYLSEVAQGKPASSKRMSEHSGNGVPEDEVPYVDAQSPYQDSIPSRHTHQETDFNPVAAAANAGRKMTVPVASSLSMLRVPPKIIDRYVNLLVVGESGLGKTTFIKNCFADLSQEAFELRDASGATMQEFRDDPDTFCTRLPPIEVPEALIRLHYSVQDVPGYGDDLQYENSDMYISEVLELIGKQNVRQCLETQGILLDELEFKHMFDACLYFIAPHQLKPVDLKFMGAISAEVPVIPIIAKSDCMTPDEREEFRERIINALKKPNLPNHPDPIEIFKFPDEVMVAAEALGLAPPFAIMASNTMEMVEGSLQPVRHYSWGTCMPLMREHSDAYFFRKTVLEYGFHALRDEKKRRYILFRDNFQQMPQQRSVPSTPAFKDTNGVSMSPQQPTPPQAQAPTPGYDQGYEPKTYDSRGYDGGFSSARSGPLTTQPNMGRNDTYPANGSVLNSAPTGIGSQGSSTLAGPVSPREDPVADKHKVPKKAIAKYLQFGKGVGSKGPSPQRSPTDGDWP